MFPCNNSFCFCFYLACRSCDQVPHTICTPQRFLKALLSRKHRTVEAPGSQNNKRRVVADTVPAEQSLAQINELNHNQPRTGVQDLYVSSKKQGKNKAKQGKTCKIETP